MGIKLSKKYGVNPTIPVCFFCGKRKNEVALLGKMVDKNQKEIEAPTYMVIDYEPCDECKKIAEKGVMLIGLTNKQPSNNRPPIRKTSSRENLYPTGTYAVITKEATERIFLKEVSEPAIKHHVLYIEEEILQNMIKNQEE